MTANPSQPPDNWQLGNPYERYVGRWSRQVAPVFLSWLDVPAGKRWLDVGCGTGALCAAIAQHCAPSSLIGVEPSEGFLAVARQALTPDVILYPGSAAELPLADGAADVIVAGLVLNFIPDLGAALREFRRVASRNATFGAYVWDYAGRMEIIRHFWDAAVALDASVIRLDEGVRFPLCRADTLAATISTAGVHDVEVAPIDVATRFSDFQEYWEPFLGGQGPAPAYAMSLDEAARARLRDRLQRQVPAQADGSISLLARAWAIRATL